jgi:putative ABC transport system permease protein
VRDLYNRIFGLLGLIILGMVFFAVVNVISMSVIERTREIGTLRAMGTSPEEIVRHFILEALMIGMIGVSLAMLLAGSVAVGLSFADLQMPPPPARSQGYPLVIYIDTYLYAGTAIFVLLLCVVAAYLASRKAAQKPIVEALTHV